MKNLNKKGFVLVETLIVTVFVVALFIVIYQATVPALGELEQQNKYDDIDTVYYSNLYKKLINRDVNINAVDNYLSNPNNHYFLNITDCSAKIGDDYIYNNREYCNFVQSSLNFTDGDIVLLTDYNISAFRAVVNDPENDFFDSGALTNFRDYLKTVSDEEYFYSRLSDDSQITGKYRLFFIRNIKETDNSITKRYANIGIYSGMYDNYFQGEEVVFDPGDGERYFYVLHNSLSSDQTVTLISTQNIDVGGTPYFNCTGKFEVPDQEHSPLIPAYRSDIEIDDRCSTVEVPNIISEVEAADPIREYAHEVDNTNTVLVNLKEATANWTNTIGVRPAYYEAESGYHVDYNTYNARLLSYDDIFELLGCKQYGYEICFDVSSAFEVPLDRNLAWLYSNLSGENGYWTIESVTGSNMYAWSIKNGKIAPTLISDHTNIGIRPVIEVSKNSISLRRLYK